MYQIGIDLGSSYTKGVLIDKTGEIVDCKVTKTGYDYKSASHKIMDEWFDRYETSSTVYSCGHGRDQLDVPYHPVSEFTTLAKAIFKKYQKSTTIIDIGGQDTKYIRISSTGNIEDFKINRKCAAGTGSFLEEIAFRLDIPLEKFNQLAQEAQKDTLPKETIQKEEITINSFCTVFAISEIVGLIKKGVSLPDIVLGVYYSVIERVTEMIPPKSSLILTGGVFSKHPLMVNLLRKIYKQVVCPEKAQFMAAFGCATAGLTSKD